MILTEKLKKYLSLGLAVSVMSLGLLSASAATASASAPAPTTVVSQDGKEITVTGGTSKLHISKKNDFYANIDWTDSKGKTQRTEVVVTTLPDQKYQIETYEKGEKNVFTSVSNPLEKMGLSAKSQNTSVPDVIIAVAITGSANYYTLVNAFGITFAN